jgi:Tol biopolymer transport system component
MKQSRTQTLIKAWLSLAILALLAAVSSPAWAKSFVTERVSVSSNGDQGNDSSHSPALSADGRYVVFNSFARNLVSGDTNRALDVFLHDRQAGQTERVSVSSSGEQGNNFTHGLRLSASGRFVALLSEASNLVSGDTNGKSDVFILDRWSGIVKRVSLSTTGEQALQGASGFAISADGSFVAFSSLDPNLVNGDTNGKSDVFVREWGMARLSYLPVVEK